MSGIARVRRPTRPQVAVVGIVAVVVVMSGVLLQGDSEARPTATPGGASPAAPSPAATDDPWTSLELPPLARVASLEPATADATGVAPGSDFTLVSLTGESPVALAARLEVVPAADFEVASQGDVAARLRPASTLEPGRVYRFTLRAPDGSIAGSWAYRVRGPVGVTSTLPGNASQGVPVRTGIEVAFNQEGVADMAGHFTISPPADGRFERHGLTQVFVPDELEPATLYTVTVRAGLGRTGTDLVLPGDVVFRFETAGGDPAEPTLIFARDVVEASPAEAPVLAVTAPFSDEPPPADTEVTVYRLPSLETAATTLETFLDQPRWAMYTSPLVPVAGLPVVSTFTAALEPFDDGNVHVLRFPAALPAGWYVVETRSPKPAHAFLQVTPVSAWVSVLSDRTVAWVNDVTTGRALAGATVSVGAGAAIARSGADGLAIGPTPAELIPPAVLDDTSSQPPASPILRIRSAAGDTVLVPFGVAMGDGYRGEWWEKTGPANDELWALLYTDRGFYRSEDEVRLWGYLRDRDDASVPAAVEVRLVRAGAERAGDAPSLASAAVRPGPTGTFTSSLPVVGLPNGNYEVQAVVDGEVVVGRWIEVTVIRKPPYRLSVTPSHAAVLAGTPVDWTVSAEFFDGTPAAEIVLDITTDNAEPEAATTDSAGETTVHLTATPNTSPGEEPWESVMSWSVGAMPNGPESAEIQGYAEALVFPSAYDVAVTGDVVAGRLELSGSIHRVDLAKVEAALANGTWDGDARGASVAGVSLTASIVELIPIRRQTGTEYDFIEKVSRPIYEYDIQTKPLPTLTVTSDADGRIAFSRAVPDATHQYRVVLSGLDDASRIVSRTTHGGTAVDLPWWFGSGPVFETADGSLAGETPFGIGDAISWRIAAGGELAPSGGTNRYLYLTAQRGLRSAAVTDSTTFEHTFAAADAPGIFVIGVRFSGSTYAPKAATWANFNVDERSIDVRISADRERYRPGERVTLSVVTTDEAGRPIPAAVVLSGVDEKLYEMGGASVPDPLGDLHTRVDSGILRLTATHQVPTRFGLEGEGGDTTGGGPRSDFRDTLFFVELQTDAAGRATTTVELSDDLTSWHVTGSAVTVALEAGVGELLVPVGLPLFVEATTADVYLAADRPVIQLRAFGEALVEGDPVEFTIASPALGLAPTTIAGTAFAPTTFELPGLVPGRVSVDVAVTAPTRLDGAGKPLADRLVQAFGVVDSRLTELRTAYGTIADPPSAAGATGIVTYTFSDAGRGRYLPLLVELAEPNGARLDRVLAQSVARTLLIEAFGRSPASLPTPAVDLSWYPGGYEDYDLPSERAGLPLLPYGGVDPWLAARAGIVVPDAWDRPQTREILRRILGLPSTQRDLAIATVAALAATGEPVLADLLAVRDLPDLTPMERVYLALGFQALGDDAGALAIERDLLATHGERLGSWTRLRVGAGLPDIVEATSLVALLAAGLGDPVADGLAAYVRDNPSDETSHALDLAGYASRMLARLPETRASFAYTVGSERTVVDLRPGQSRVVELTPAQARTLTLARISGDVGVAMEARVPVDAGSLRPSRDLTLARTGPSGPIEAGGLVLVTLRATFAATAPANACYEVVELAPSGLAPLETGMHGTEGSVVWPSGVEGQEVRFCVIPGVSGRDVSLRYRARVINEGTFAWEPAVLQLEGAPEALAFTPEVTVVIRRP